MKRYILLLALMPLFSFSQLVNFHIEGQIKKTDDLKYAYLVSIGSKDIFIQSPIINSKFNFVGSTDLSGEDLRFGFVFLDKRGDLKLDEIKSKLDQRIWTLGLTSTLKSIVVEDMTLEIESSNELSTAKVISGGMLTKETEETALAIQEKDILGFVKKHPDSPMSILAIQHVVKFLDAPISGGVQSIFGSLAEMYNALSERLQKSEKGLAIKKRLDAIKK